jgi:hypothetical protein
MNTLRSSLCLTVCTVVVISGCAPVVRPPAPPPVEQPATESMTLLELRATAEPQGCPSSINTKDTTSFGHNWSTPDNKSCKTKMSHGFPIPDSQCTPGAFNPTLTLAVFQEHGFTTNCVRDDLTPESQKEKTYDWYGMTKPDNNSSPTETCELDHLVPLVMGGADSLDNIWPQCGPKDVVRKERYFPQKDCVELYLADQVRTGAKNLAETQRAIAKDWTQFLSEATTVKAKKPCLADSDKAVK